MFSPIDTHESGIHQITLHFHYPYLVTWSWICYHQTSQASFSWPCRVRKAVIAFDWVCCEYSSQERCLIFHWIDHVFLFDWRSERVGKTNVGGTLLTEAKYINLSLHYLEQVKTAVCNLLCFDKLHFNMQLNQRFP